MIRDKFGRLPYRFKIIIELTLMSFLPIMIFTLFFSYMIRVDQIERMDVVSIQRVEKVQERTELILQNIWESYFEIFLTESVDTVMTQDISYQDYSIYADAIDQLQGQYYLRNYIRGFTLVNLDTGWVLSSRGMYRFSDAENAGEFLSIVETEDYRNGMSVHSEPKGTEDLPHSTIDLEGSYLLYCLPAASRCVLVVNLNMDAFLEYLDDEDEYEITVLDRDNRLLLTTEENAAAYLEKNADQVKAGSWVSLPDRSRVRVGAVSAELGYFQYIVTYDSAMAGVESRRVLSFSVILLVVLLITGVMILFTGKRVYQPVLSLMDRLAGFVFSDKDQKVDAIEFIENNISSMISTIKGQKDEIMRYFMSRLLSGNIQEEEIQSCLQEMDLQTYPVYCVIALSPPVDVGEHQEIERNALLKAIVEGLSVGRKLDDILAFRVWNKALILLTGDRAEDVLEEKILSVEERIQTYLKANGIDNVQFGASLIFSSLEYTIRAYHEAMEAVKVSELEGAKTGSPHLVMYEDIAQTMNQTAFYSASSEIRIRELVDACREREACVEVRCLVNELYEKRMPSVERRYYLYRLLFAILEVLNDAGLPVGDIKTTEGTDLLFAFGQLYGNEDILNFFTGQVIPSVIRQVKDFRNTHTSDVRAKVIQMIRKTQGDITLAECAEKLNYSTNYLGRIIRCENNESFSDYVAEQKIAYAKSLLEETERSVADIAQELNYSNTQNFIRFFSKREGMTPGKYRQNCRDRAGMSSDENK